MKKRFIFAMMAIASMLSLASCDDKETEGLTGITYYAVLDLEGETEMVVNKGDTFVDPGFTATLNGENVNDQVVINSNVNTNKSGVYKVTYSVTNADGFTASSSRTVIVLDLNDDVEGFYIVDASSYRDYNGTTTAFGRPFQVLVINNGDGTYTVDDILGGWYCQRAGYGANYNMEAIITINDDDTVTLEDSYIPGWGDGLTDFEGTFDATASTFTYRAVYVSGMAFNVTMSKE